ncbi:MAG: hypothetical protein OCD02_23495 [Spirochaetaceae bacterium]
MNLEQTKFINEINIIYKNSIKDDSNSDIILQTKSNNKDNDQIYKILIEDSKNNKFYEHDFEFDVELESEDLSNICIIVKRKVIIDKLQLWVYLDHNQFYTRNVFNFPKGDFYIIQSQQESDKDSLFYKDFVRYLEFIKLMNDSCDFKNTQNNYSFILEGSKPFCINITKGQSFSYSKYLDKILSINKNSSDKNSFIEEFRIIFKTNLANYIKIHRFKDIIEFTPVIEDFMKDVFEDYRILISKFSFKELKTQFIEEKNKYTLLLNNHISNVIKLIYSIPLSAGLSIILKIEDTEEVSTTILFVSAFIFFAIVSIIIIIHNYTSLNLTHSFILNEESKLKNIDLDNETTLFKDEFKKHFDMFYTKINLTKVLSIFLIIIFIGFSTYFLITSFHIDIVNIRKMIFDDINFFVCVN